MSDMRSLGLNLAGQALRLEFDQSAAGCAEIMGSLFKGFLTESEHITTRLRIICRTCTRRLPLSLTEIEILKAEDGFPGEKLRSDPYLYHMTRGLGFSQSNTIITGVQGGLLAFYPSSGDGHIILLNTNRVEELISPLYRLIFLFCSVILGRSGFFLAHGAAVESSGEGLVFLGHSGSGKTHLAQKWSDGDVLSDDAPAITSGPGGFQVWASPYSQFDFQKIKVPDRYKACLPLKRILFLRRGSSNSIKPLHNRTALGFLIEQIHGLNMIGTCLRKKVFETAYQISRSIPAFLITFGTQAKGENGRTIDNVYRIIENSP